MHDEVHMGRFRYDYPDGVAYEVTCASTTSLHWRCVGGDDQGREASETIDRVPLSEHQHLLSWTEADNLVVTQVVDYTAGRVDTVLVLPGGKRLVLQGSVRRL
jgi:phenolic acid decarboxylase